MAVLDHSAIAAFSLTAPDEVKVVSSDDDGALHLELLDDAIEDSAADLDESGEGAFLVDVIALLRLHRGLEAQTHVLHITDLMEGLMREEVNQVLRDIKGRTYKNLSGN